MEKVDQVVTRGKGHELLKYIFERQRCCTDKLVGETFMSRTREDVLLAEVNSGRDAMMTRNKQERHRKGYQMLTRGKGHELLK
jgi:hypothetical protein